jgi:hypothetical protein
MSAPYAMKLIRAGDAGLPPLNLYARVLRYDGAGEFVSADTLFSHAQRLCCLKTESESAGRCEPLVADAHGNAIGVRSAPEYAGWTNRSLVAGVRLRQSPLPKWLRA